MGTVSYRVSFTTKFDIDTGRTLQDLVDHLVKEGWITKEEEFWYTAVALEAS